MEIVKSPIETIGKAAVSITGLNETLLCKVEMYEEKAVLTLRRTANNLRALMVAGCSFQSGEADVCAGMVRVCVGYEEITGFVFDDEEVARIEAAEEAA